MNLGFDEPDHMKFMQVGIDGTNLSKITDSVPGSGHPTIHPDGRHILTDTYVNEPLPFGDGTTPLRWIDLKEGSEQAIIRIRTDSPQRDALRIDPHPAWDRSWQSVFFNAFVDGTRRVFLADMRSLLKDD
jgi:Tol biopolymer transport system component